MQKKKILVIYETAGGGHQAAARAIDGAVAQMYPGEFEIVLMPVRAATDSQRVSHLMDVYNHLLKIKPDDPSVLSNLGLSYVLTKELPKAEATLRRAHQLAPNDSRIRQNLGLALGLQGRFAEAEAIVQADLPPDEAAANVAYLKSMLSSGQAGKTAAGQRNAALPRS